MSDKRIDILVFLGIWGASMAFVAVSKEPVHLHMGEVAYSLSRGVLACLVFFVLIPKLWSQRRYLSFCLVLVFLLFVFGSLEEGVLEPAFFPESRGREGWSWIGVHRFVFEMAPLLGAVLIAKLALDQRRSQVSLERLRAETQAHELRFLKSQINPHMLFNTLNNIYAYVLTADERAPSMVKRLADFLRYVLYEATAEALPLQKDIAALNHFLTLQEMAIKDRGKVMFTSEGRPEGKWVLPLMLAHVVENCFKHSLDSQTRDIVIDIKLQIHPSELLLTTKNSYREGETNRDGNIREKGIGLANLRRRLALQFGEDFHLETARADGFFHTALRMPLWTHPPRKGA